MKASEAVGRNPGASGKILVQALLSAALQAGVASRLSAAVPAPMLKLSVSQRARGAAKAASPTMPLSTPMDVMPICTTERNLVGCSCSSIAQRAPASPDSTITCSRALRLAVNAISDMANRALSRIRKTSRATSMQGARQGEERERSRIG